MFIDREMVTHGPPRVRMRDGWRVDERFLEAARAETWHHVPGNI
jgi:hypothetical protein